jgi:hypothetical protein
MLRMLLSVFVARSFVGRPALVEPLQAPGVMMLLLPACRLVRCRGRQSVLAPSEHIWLLAMLLALGTRERRLVRSRMVSLIGTWRQVV